jgi:glycine/D-amino acid oxidase-like deaminating enzyme
VETPFWLTDSSPPPMTRTLGTVDVEIVGAGITGWSAALVLAEGGLRVRVRDYRGVAEGASGRNGGFALRGGAARYDVARETYGVDAARTLWRRTEDELDRIEELGGDAFRRVGSLRLAADDEERDEIRGEFEALASDGFAVEWRDELPQSLAPHFRAGMFHVPDGALQPARFARKVASRAIEAGVELRRGRVASLEQLDADHVVIATDGSGRGLLSDLDDAIWPARGQVVATEPLGERLFEYPHYARHGLDYWQQLPDNRIVLGGFRDFSIMSEMTDDEVTTPLIQDALETFLVELLGSQPRIEYRWAGIFGLTQDLLPLVGPVPARDGTWVAAGYSGHGNVLGFLCGRLVASAILGREDPLLALFDPARLLAAPPALSDVEDR